MSSESFGTGLEAVHTVFFALKVKSVQANFSSKGQNATPSSSQTGCLAHFGPGAVLKVFSLDHVQVLATPQLPITGRVECSAPRCRGQMAGIGRGASVGAEKAEK